MKKEYHFEHTDGSLDKTIRLDHINEKVKELEEAQKAQEEDELGDKDAFLDAFDSERFDTTQQNTPVGREPMQPQAEGGKEDNEESALSNKRMIGILALVGVVVCIACFLFVGRGLFGSDPDQQEEVLPQEGTQFTALLRSIFSEGEILVYDLQAEENRSLTLLGNTVYTDADGKAASFSMLEKGMLLSVQMEEVTETAIEISAKGEFWTESDVTEAQTDPIAQTIQIGEKRYDYDTHTLFFYGEETLSAADLEPCDVLKLRGSGNTVWSVEVEKSHGYLTLSNQDAVKDGSLSIDGKEKIVLESIERLALSEGVHEVTVSGSNIEERTDTVFIEVGKEFTYDLSRAQEKVGVLIVNANVDGYKLYVNGTSVDPSQPVVLPLGDYEVVILKSGYHTFTENISLTEDTYTLRATLEQEKGVLSVTTFPIGVHVSINGAAYGISPMNATLPYGTYTLELTAEDYIPYSTTVTIGETPVSLSVELEEE